MSPTVIPTAPIQTNAAGNGVSKQVFTPADAAGLRHQTLGAIWTATTRDGSPSYQTGCETVVLD
jgi:hypothetical protein